MERILVLMKAKNWPEAAQPLQQARESAQNRQRLTFALLLSEEPTPQDLVNMQTFGTLQWRSSAEGSFADMEALWHGERYVALTHPAMRFAHHWEAALLKALHACTAETEQAVLTGFLPAENDPIGAVCPVAAEKITPDGVISWTHGLPLKMAAKPMPGAFLHPDFFFARAGFVRVMAQGTGAAFVWAMARDWQSYTLNVPVIRVAQDLPVPPVQLFPQDEGMEKLRTEYGVDCENGTLSAAARRGLKTDSLDVALAVTPLLRVRERLRRRFGRRDDLIPLGVTVCPATLDEESMHWLRQMTQMQDVSLLCYAEGTKLREVADFHPNVLEYKARHALTLPEGKTLFSRAAILSAARDRVLSGTHYVWLAPDAVRYPLYPGLALRWKRLCGDQIVLAMVREHPDLSMVVVPDQRLKPLLAALQEQLRLRMARGESIQQEEMLWQDVIREHPDWFAFHPLPVEKQLFTLLL